MPPAGVHLWKLSEGGAGCLGLACTEDGLFLGGTALIERRQGRYAVRPQADLDRLFGRAYQDGIAVERLIPGLHRIAAALAESNLCLAQIGAPHLRLPDLPDRLARGALEAEDVLIKRAQDGYPLVRGGWDPAEHPRAGVPPNPGWFADKPSEVAQNEEDERALEEMRDPTAELRQALWDARIATLRRIDPKNLQLTYLANPGSPPSQAALDRLVAALEAAATKRVTDKLMPGGVPIGRAGNSKYIRELPGGPEAAKRLFDYLRVGGIVYGSDAKRTTIELPGKAGFITYRGDLRSHNPAVDVNVPGVPFKRVHFS